MTSINPHIFRAYDIRGKVGSDITEDVCRQVGQGFGTVLRQRYRKDHPDVVVGWDARTHSPGFAAAAIEGLKAAGCRVLVMGMTPSPVNYFITCAKELDGGLQITASHNPKEDNGIKLQVRNAEAYSGEDLQDLRRLLETGALMTGKGTTEDLDAVTPYLKHLNKLFDQSATGLKVVVDAGNGVAGPVYAAAMRNAGADVLGLYLEPDGTFPNHPADPSQHPTLRELQTTVRETDAGLGLAFDGDGDRMGVVDENGVIRTPDEVLLLLAQDLLSRHAGSPVVFTVSNSGILESEIERLGGKPVMCKVGHSHVEYAMRKEQALLGGEQSGHFFCAEGYFGFDDALVAALRFLQIVRQEGKPLSKVLAAFPAVYQAPERRPHCPDDKKADVIRRATAHFAKTYPVNTLDGARIDFGDGAWAGLRQSNTSPKLSVCIEARSPEKLQEVEDIVLGHLKTYPEIGWNEGVGGKW
ncbi:MAG: phosphomannomutase/phosphoglucomutase [Candidatus Peribacteraceae bacterium]|nr:phosphomannomutase/phosphoglucomutase [Candidatus Peribacteraceae bacterium]